MLTTHRRAGVLPLALSLLFAAGTSAHAAVFHSLAPHRPLPCPTCDDDEGGDAGQAPAAPRVVALADTARREASPGTPTDTRAESVAKPLGTVTVRGARPTSLPSYIPTTVEGVAADTIAQTVNAADAQDALKYFPSLLVRKRYIGDFDHAVLASRASGTGNSARSLVYADGILLSNLLGNGASFTPRWGLVAAEEIDRVDVLYGPFSAAYPGNSVGAVVDYVTRMPKQFEVYGKVAAFTQRFALYNTDARYSGSQASAGLGSRHGAFSWWLNANRLDNDGQPLTFATKLRTTGVATSAGTPVTGAVPGLSPRNQDWWLIAAGTQINTVQDHVKAKIAYDLRPGLTASYVLGLWQNDAQRFAESYLRDAAGRPVYAGVVNMGNQAYTIGATEISPSRNQLTHIVQGIALKQTGAGSWQWQLAASDYDYRKDFTRAPLIARPFADAGGAGRITDQSGTGWTTLAATATWRRTERQQVDIGVQRDTYRLRTLVSDTQDWISGAASARFSAFTGTTRLTSLFAQSTTQVADAWRATLGARYESWQAEGGSISNAASTIGLASRASHEWSPKAALAWQATPAWQVRASLGRAVRNPTVSELYQGSISTNVVVNNDPNLKSERSWTGELTALRDLSGESTAIGAGTLRATLFAERTQDALYSQTNVSVTPNVTNIQNVDRIRTRGFELALQADDWVARGLDVSASVTFADSIITQNSKFPVSVGKWQPRVPRWRANLVASWRIDDVWSATAGVRYSGRQFNTLDNVDPNGDAYTGVSKFTVADVRVRFKVTRQWTLSAGIDNLNNQRYWNFHPYPARTFVAEARFAL